MRSGLLLALPLVLAVYSTGSAQVPWARIGNSNAVLDTSRTVMDSIGRRFRLRATEQALLRSPSADTTAFGFQSELHFYVDCSGRRVRYGELRLYSLRDSLLSVLPLGDRSVWTPFEKDPFAPQIPMDSVCAILRRQGIP